MTPKVALRAVKNDPMALYCVSNELKDNPKFVLKIIKNDLNYLGLASDKIQKICENGDPIEILKSIIRHEKLKKDMPQTTQKITSKIKI